MSHSSESAKHVQLHQRTGSCTLPSSACTGTPLMSTSSHHDGRQQPKQWRAPARCANNTVGTTPAQGFKKESAHPEPHLGHPNGGWSCTRAALRQQQARTNQLSGRALRQPPYTHTLAVQCTDPASRQAHMCSLPQHTLNKASRDALNHGLVRAHAQQQRPELGLRLSAHHHTSHAVLRKRLSSSPQHQPAQEQRPWRCARATTPPQSARRASRERAHRQHSSGTGSR
jgi:hypothetical protein